MKPAWRLGLAAAALALLPAAIGQAWALELGALRLQSQRGQPLRAEVDVLQLEPGQAASLRLSIAAPAEFSARQLVWNEALNDIQITPHNNPDGTVTLQLSSSQPVRLPAFDLMLKADWPGGALIKAYTLVLGGSQTESSSAEPAASRYTVRRGDTLAAIAAGLPQASQVDLDQMLLALQQANPDAFAAHNVNLLKTGAVLKLPTAEQAQAIPVQQAQQKVAAQSADFDAYRQRLAQAGGGTVESGDSRSSGGRIQAEVKPAAGAVQDKLTLTQAASGSRAATEASLIAAQQQSQQLQQQLQAINTRVAALSTLVASAASAASHPKPAPVADSLLRQWLAPLAGVGVALLALLLWLRRQGVSERRATLGGTSLQPPALQPDSGPAPAGMTEAGMTDAGMTDAGMPDFFRAALALDLNLEPEPLPAVEAGAESTESTERTERTERTEPSAGVLTIDLSGFDDSLPRQRAKRPLFDFSGISLDLDPPEPPAAGAESVADPCSSASRSD